MLTCRNDFGTLRDTLGAHPFADLHYASSLANYCTVPPEITQRLKELVLRNDHASIQHTRVSYATLLGCEDITRTQCAITHLFLDGTIMQEKLSFRWWWDSESHRQTCLLIDLAALDSDVLRDSVTAAVVCNCQTELPAVLLHIVSLYIPSIPQQHNIEQAGVEGFVQIK